MSPALDAPAPEAGATLDVDWVRAQFPAFADPEIGPWAHMENAGGSYAARATIERLADFYTRSKVQPYGPSTMATRAGRLMDEARARLAGLLNVAGDEVLIGPSTSQNAYVLAHAFASGWRESDEIVVTEQDHEANSGAWRRLAERGITVREWRVDPETGRLDPADLASLLSERTRLVAFPHASNIAAEINPVAAIARRIHEAGAVAVVDGVSAAPHGLPDVAALGADVYFFSAYKTYGPHQGVMVVRRELNRRLANQGHGFNDGHFEKRLVPAGPDHAQIAALGGVADYLDAMAERHAPSLAPPDRARATAELMRAREIGLTERLLAYVDTRPELRLLGPREAAARASTVALAHARPGADLAEALAAHRVGAGGGDFYAPRLLRAMGVDPDHGVLRLSFLHYTTEAEIDRTIEALDAVL